MRDKCPALLLLLALAALPAAANPFGYLTALVPLNPGTIAGAFGAQWTTTLWAANNSDADVQIACRTIASGCTALAAHSIIRVASPAGLTHPGFFVEVPEGIVPQNLAPNAVSFDLRVTDSVTVPTWEGTEVPLPRPDDFGPVVLLPHVPLDGHSRLKVRIYGLTDGAVTVRSRGNISRLERVNTTVALTGNGDGSLHVPSYGELDMSSGPAPDDTALAVEVDAPAGMNVWAMVSVTDNDSQRFTIIAPQRLQYVPISIAAR